MLEAGLSDSEMRAAKTGTTGTVRMCDRAFFVLLHGALRHAFLCRVTNAVSAEFFRTKKT